MRLVCSLLVLFLAAALPAQSAFSFAGESVPAGSRRDFSIPVAAGDTATTIPITVLHGATDGPVLSITAGVHGYEYPPILAAQRLGETIDPDTLRGTVILVRIANLPSFLGRSPFVSPLDGRNLNRSFPGRPDGSLTERIAHFITAHVIASADYFLDLHGGDAPEDLMPYGAYYDNDGQPEASEQGRAMAVALGFDFIVRFNTDGKDYMRPDHPSLYCSAEAFRRGIPAADVECGRLGLAEPLLVDRIAGGVAQVLRTLDMLPAARDTTPVGAPAFITDRSYLEAAQDGIFYPAKRAGEYVTAGMEIGYVTDYFGTRVQTIVADTAGVLLLVIGTPPIRKGETMAVIGQVE
ncbi:succinylglutamate desuccinylase/aspartoacylase family protein [Lewinella sp. IMCC34183]|uniref:succinylglutamate desuccinylase/aspartoacylase family protein n=1 Tax=Lewinella sp. IMCC34183 TaxID=2248762 RepID=UPI000E27A1FB|nr:M14 family metallopeptidase [Lewinella sp. IMCC34183]